MLNRYMESYNKHNHFINYLAVAVNLEETVLERILRLKTTRLYALHGLMCGASVPTLPVVRNFASTHPPEVPILISVLSPFPLYLLFDFQIFS